MRSLAFFATPYSLGLKQMPPTIESGRRLAESAQSSCPTEADVAPELPPARDPSSNSSNSTWCPAWRSELEAAGILPPRQPLEWRLKRQIDNLITHWLRPFKHGIWPENLRTHEPKNRTAVEWFGLGEGRQCPLVSVVGGRVFLEIPEGSHFFTLPLSGCSKTSEGGRQLTVLRLLFIALRQHRLPDFQFRLCSDDYCHGLFEAGAGTRSLPLLTSVCCETARTIPSVQWNVLSSRDPDLGEWDATLSRLRAQRHAHARLWECRQPKAVWRGSIADHHVYNTRWSSRGELAQERVVASNWQRAGRVALAYQKCRHPELLDVRFKLLRQRNNFDSNCTAVASRDRPAGMPMTEQARRFRYMVHVEGIAGWADRLRHVLLSGATPLKQEMGVGEWFEPLLEPWKHYVPVSSTLSNLSSAILWARENDAKARKITIEVARLMEGVLSEDAVVYYQVQLFVRYASLWRGANPLQRPISRSLTWLNCTVEAQSDAAWETDCKLLDPETGEDSFHPIGEPASRYRNLKHHWLTRNGPPKDAPRPAGQLWLEDGVHEPDFNP